MQQTVPSNKKTYVKSKIAVGLVVLIIAGFFAYKYSYIYIERRKYDRATVAINKVADDLRAQGINTEFSRGCQKAEGVFGPGALSCSVGISYTGDEKNTIPSEVLNKFTKSMSMTIFKLKSDLFIKSSAEISGGPNVYTLLENGMECNLRYSPQISGDISYEINFVCVKDSRFKII